MRNRVPTNEGEAKLGRKSAAGFTLVELLIVVAIIGILAAIVVPKMMIAVDDANVTAAKAQIRVFKTALVSYKLKFKKYPSTSEGLEALVNNPKANFLDADKVPLDPWRGKYSYTCPGKKGHDYEIVCFGEDGKAGGADYAADIVSWDLQKET